MFTKPLNFYAGQSMAALDAQRHPRYSEVLQNMQEAHFNPNSSKYVVPCDDRKPFD